MISEPRIVRFGAFEFDPRAGELRKDGVLLKLQEKPLRLLELLLDRPGDLVTREELRQKLWPADVFVNFDNNLNNAINRVRGVLGDAAGSPRFIETLGRRGYRFIAPVRSEVREAVARFRRLAVLPFENLSAAPGQDFLADGMTEALIAELAQIQALRVISRTSVMRFKGSQRPLPDIARELAVDAVVEGSVSRSANLVRVSVRLIDPRSDTQLLARAAERKVEDLLSLQSELAAAIADEIVELTEQERARLRRPRRVKPEVPEAYLRGRYHWNRRSEAGLNKGIECFLKVIEQDPDFALAHAGLADCYNSLGTVPLGHPPRQMRPRAKAAASRALEIDSELGEAHAALAYAQLYDWEWTEAERGFARALEINPSYAEAHAWFAHYLSARGRLRQALEQSRLASELDPLSLYVRSTAGFVLYLAGRYEEASAQYRSALELEPGAVLPLVFEGFNALQQGRFEHAITSLEEADRATSRNHGIQGWLVQAYALGGQRARAAELLRALMQAAGERYVPPAALAFAHFGLGEIDRGFEWMGVAAEERSNVLVYLAVVPAFAAIRGDARYEALLTRMNLHTDGNSGS